jgi:DNA polymerase III delta subunit
MAIINQARRLLVVKNFIQENKNVWKTGLTYPEFQKRVMPAAADYDKKFSRAFLRLEPNAQDNKKKSLSIGTSAYPAYQTFIKSDNFTMEELIYAFECLGKLDINFKSGYSDPQIALQQTIISLFSKKR